MYKVVVIEDEDIIRQGLIASIDWGNFDCQIVGEAGNGKDGLKLIEKVKPDIIILDVNMPIMSGLEMISFLPNNMYSFIIVSGHSEFNYAKEAIRLNVSEYLLKPLDHNLFENALVEAIEDLEMRRFFLSKEEVIDQSFQILDLNIAVESVSLTLVINYIRDHFNEKISMEDLRRVSDKSTTSINTRFQKHLNMTFNEYLTDYRIQTAIHLISNLDLHLYEVAEAVGYSDYKYFNQVFKRIVGVSPKIVETYYLRKQQ